ncbi:MAG: hypothetical protein FJY97_20185 [candidate division Zixibacteria bacterium]|nr:hypothetical protein [candidate division Zixibacteria bacterium]
MKPTVFLLAVLFFFGLQTASSVASSGHAFHVSVCEIEHNPSDSTLEISFKLFADDLEEALKTAGAGVLKLGTPEENEEADRHIARYLSQHVRIEINGKPVSWRFLGKETEADALWCYAEIPGTSSVKTIAVTSTVLLEVFEDQANLVHVRVGGQRKSLLLNHVRTKDDVTF